MLQKRVRSKSLPIRLLLCPFEREEQLVFDRSDFATQPMSFRSSLILLLPVADLVRIVFHVDLLPLFAPINFESRSFGWIKVSPLKLN